MLQESNLSKFKVEVQGSQVLILLFLSHFAIIIFLGRTKFHRAHLQTKIFLSFTAFRHTSYVKHHRLRTQHTPLFDIN